MNSQITGKDLTAQLEAELMKVAMSGGAPKTLQAFEFFCKPCNFPFIVSYRFGNDILSCPLCGNEVQKRKHEKIVSISLW